MPIRRWPGHSRWQRLSDKGRFASVSELATAERIELGYLGTVLRLTPLAPQLAEAIVDGRDGDGLSLPGLMAGVSEGWPKRHRIL